MLEDVVAPTVRLLGRPAVRFRGEEIEPTPGKTSALLLYAACAPGWVPRDECLFLLWPDTPEDRARNNLRQLLHRIGHVDYANALEREPGRVRWDVPTDLDRFRSALARGDAGEAVARYGGSLLDGYRLGEAPEFEDWLELERRELHAAWRSAALEHARSLRSGNRPDRAAAVLERVLQADPLDEVAFRERLEALAEAGQRAEALASFDAFAERLDRDLGIGPERETVAAAAQLRSEPPVGTQPREPHTSGSPHGPPRTLRPRPLPASATPFVGRVEELDALRSTLRTGGVRLLSIVAAGGMGKTRLALALAKSLAGEYADGVAFASFASIDRPEQMEAALADAVGVPVSRGEPLREQLMRYLSGREMLLVLDNLEHLTRDLSLIVELLQRCDRIVNVTTSRERLHLSQEWVYDLSGLAHGGPAVPGTPPTENDAERLFVQVARRVGAVDVDELDPSRVAGVCRRVRGMPLAIGMAAAWLRILAIDEILAGLERDMDLLRTDDADVNDRHRSMHAVFDATWSRLGALERDAWTRLALFAGSFDRQAAAAVADVGVPLLLALVNKSVVSRDGLRFDLHPLVRQYGRRRAKELGIVDETRARHAQHYLTWFGDHARAFRGPEQVAAFERAFAELPNLRAAWTTAIDRGDAGLVADVALELAEFHEAMGLRSEFVPLANRALAAFAEATEALEADPAPVRVVGRVLPWAGAPNDSPEARLRRSVELAVRTGDLRGEAHAHIERIADADGNDMHEHGRRAIACFASLEDEHGIARAERVYGWSLVLGGLYDDALQMLERASARFRRLGDSYLEARAIEHMAPVYIMRGEFDQAERLIERALEASEGPGSGLSRMDTLGSLQWLEMVRGDFEAAEAYQDAFFEQMDAMGYDSSGTRTFLRAGLRYLSGDYERARPLAEARLQDHRDAGAREIGTVILALIVGRIALRVDADPGRARPVLREAFEITLELGTPRFLPACAVATAELLLVEGGRELAARLAKSAHVDHATEYEVHMEIDRLIEHGLELGDGVAAFERSELRSVLREVYGMAADSDAFA